MFLAGKGKEKIAMRMTTNKDEDVKLRKAIN